MSGLKPRPPKTNPRSHPTPRKPKKIFFTFGLRRSRPHKSRPSGEAAFIDVFVFKTAAFLSRRAGLQPGHKQISLFFLGL
jgi:hypothetical protein